MSKNTTNPFWDDIFDFDDETEELGTESLPDDDELDDDELDDDELDDERMTDYPDNDLCRQWVRQLTYIAGIVEQASLDSDEAWVLKGEYAETEFLLLAIYLNPSLTKYFAPAFNTMSYKLLFPRYVYARHEQIAAVLSVMEANLEKAKNWYHDAYRTYAAKIEKQLRDTLRGAPAVEPDISSEDYAAHLVKHLQPIFFDMRELNANKHKLSQHRAFAQQLHAQLHKHVKGQPEAIRTLVRNEINLTSGGQSKLRGLFTFVGPSGVGKTELAKRYAEAISAIENTQYRSMIFNMEQYADEKSFFQLTGPGKQYSEAMHGQLTQFVKFNPRSVIVFDEIEKAHKVAIQSLLTLLDSGQITDNSTGEVTDFSQCVIIFTSNLGAREFAAAKTIGEVDLFDVLANSSYDQGNRLLTLAPEFINRLRSGTGIRFKSLNALHFSEIASHALNHYKAPSNSGVAYKIDANVAGLLALNKLPEISARAIPQSLSEIIGRLSTKLFQEPALYSAIDQIKTVQLKIADNFYEQWSEKQPICFIGSDQKTANDFDNGLSAYALVHLSTAEDVEANMNRMSHFDAFVLDAAHLSAETLIEVIGLITPYMAKTPTIVLGYENYSSDIFDAVWKFIPASQVTQNAAHLQQLLEVSGCIRHAERKNLKFEFTMSYRSGKKQVVYEIHSPRYKQVIGVKRVQAGVPGLVQERPSITLDDVIGLQRAKSQLKRILTLLKHSEKLKQEKIKMPAGIVLTGPPGTGKTMLARAVAGETQLRFLSLNVADLSSQYAGGTTQKIKELFEAARDVAPSIVFIDEIDALAARRSQNDSSTQADNNKTVNALLSYLDGLEEQSEPVFVIGATNNPELLDPAIVRPGRLDTPIMCDLPDVSAREDFLRKFSKDYGVSFSDTEIEAFVSLTMGLSGADMEKVFSECRIALALEQIEKDEPTSERKVTVAMLRKAVATARFGTLNEGPRLTEHARKVTAWHEAGHLVVLKLLTPDTDVPFATIEPRNQAQGFIVSQRNMQNGAATKSEIEAEIAIYMAGREGERMLGNDLEITAGASQDIRMATFQATRAVCELGLDDAVGQVNLRVLAEYGLTSGTQEAQARIQEWLKDGQTTARRVLEENKALFEQVAEALFKHESLYADDIARLFEDQG